ncbi:MAG TPA: hypothetical protein VFS42_05125 [Burkholderiaceae bacterium]|nr:hypothetical protein [Burkholderiaceae bacterium]
MKKYTGPRDTLVDCWPLRRAEFYDPSIFDGLLNNVTVSMAGHANLVTS